MSRHKTLQKIGSLCESCREKINGEIVDLMTEVALETLGEALEARRAALADSADADNPLIEKLPRSITPEVLVEAMGGRRVATADAPEGPPRGDGVELPSGVETTQRSRTTQPTWSVRADATECSKCGLVWREVMCEHCPAAFLATIQFPGAADAPEGPWEARQRHGIDDDGAEYESPWWGVSGKDGEGPECLTREQAIAVRDTLNRLDAQQEG